MNALPAPPVFIPVPSRTARRDGWTPARQHEFLVQLCRIGLVGAAARAVGMSRKSAYALRARAGAESFAAAWDQAVEWGIDAARATAIDRAIHGEATPIFYRGLQIGERRRYSDGLMIAALRLARRDGCCCGD